MPIKRLSTRSRRTIPCLPPISFSLANSAMGARIPPSSATGSPRSKAMPKFGVETYWPLSVSPELARMTG
jgi:hypothetical protein